MAGPSCKIAWCNHQEFGNPSWDRHTEEDLRNFCDDTDVRADLGKWEVEDPRKWKLLLEALESPQMSVPQMKWMHGEFKALFAP